jgi:hypothetical protein
LNTDVDMQELASICIHKYTYIQRVYIYILTYVYIYIYTYIYLHTYINMYI